MTAHKLTKEQKKAVIESIDKGSTVSEVKRIFGILESSFKAAGAVTESAARRPRADAQKRRTSGAPDAKVLRESADKAEGNGYGRWQQLAGLVNGK
jgi:transposase-like protein